MARPSLSEKFMIDEGLEATPRPTDATKFVLPEDIARIGDLARNVGEDALQEFRQQFGQTALAIAAYSWGLRRTYPRDAKPVYEDPTMVEYDGDMTEDITALMVYDLRDLNRVEIGSGRSQDKIVFDQVGQQWRARFETGRGGQQYRRFFHGIGSTALYDPDFKHNVWDMDEDEFTGYVDAYWSRRD